MTIYQALSIAFTSLHVVIGIITVVRDIAYAKRLKLEVDHWQLNCIPSTLPSTSKRRMICSIFSRLRWNATIQPISRALLEWSLVPKE
jgi:hypothetical protein